MREAMIALSSGQVAQSLRSFLPVGTQGTFAMMPAVLPQGFGAKLVSVYPEPDNPGGRRHQGLVVLFDRDSGAPVFVGDAEEITRIRTAAASAAATDALARKDAAVLTVIGTGHQAEAHIQAISAVRAGHIAEGCHINLVGSSGPATAEALPDLVAKGLFIGDHREHVLVHGGEFLRAKADGLVNDNHFACEIGEVFAGHHKGRTDTRQITIYKSLGHATQDLACAAWLMSGQR